MDTFDYTLIQHTTCPQGSIQYVSMQDLESGKVKIPTGPPPNPPSQGNNKNDLPTDYPEPLQ